MTSPTVVSKSLITRIRRDLSEIETRATGDELRSAFNKSVPRAEREQLHGFVRGDAAVLVDCGNMLLEMERIKDNEEIFLAWIDALLAENAEQLTYINSGGVSDDLPTDRNAPAAEAVRAQLEKYREELSKRDQELSSVATEPRLA